MTTTAAISAPPIDRHRKPGARIALRALATLALIGLADWLLLEGPADGLATVVLFFTIATSMLGLAWRNATTPRTMALSAVLCLTGITPLVENISPLSLCVAYLLIAAAHRVAEDLALGIGDDIAALAARIAKFSLGAPFRLPFDIKRINRAAGRAQTAARTWANGLVWVMPVSLSLVFLALFAAANPLLENLLAAIDIVWLLKLLSGPRILFWIVTGLVFWAFLAPRTRIRTRPSVNNNPGASVTAPVIDGLFGQRAIIRSLILFNGLFALQSLSDAAFLWGGIALPEGMSHAQYAHRGAYPLIITALLAAGFVLAAMKPGNPGATPAMTRVLVYAFIAQNIGLVLSSILRLDLYVNAFALTYWRVAAFIWMALVATGLILILIRISTGRSNRWLVSGNLAALMATLYLSCFVNFAGLIGNWNVTHAETVRIDPWYLASLGRHALPAMLTLQASHQPLEQNASTNLDDCIDILTAELVERQSSWRTLTLRDHRLRLTLAKWNATKPAGNRQSAIMPLDTPQPDMPERITSQPQAR
jgi:hypothetical protein